MSRYPIIDLFYSANKVHSRFEETFHRKMVPAPFEGSSKAQAFLSLDRRQVYLLLEYPGDRHALDLFAQIMHQLEKVSPKDILFVVEGYGSPGLSAPKHSLLYIAGEIARRCDIAIASGIKNISYPDTAAEVIRRCAKLTPPELRKQVIGSLLLTDAQQNSRRSRQNVVEAIETLFSAWNSFGERVVGISELYSAVDAQRDIPEEQRKIVNAGMSAAASESEGVFDLQNWQKVADLVAKVQPEGISREKVLGMLVMLNAPQSESPLPDYLRAMRRMLENWQGLVGWEELHRCLLQAKKDLERSSESFLERAQRISQVLGQVQSEGTTRALRQLLQDFPKAGFIVVVATPIHEKSIWAAFSYGDWAK